MKPNPLVYLAAAVAFVVLFAWLKPAAKQVPPSATTNTSVRVESVAPEDATPAHAQPSAPEPAEMAVAPRPASTPVPDTQRIAELQELAYKDDPTSLATILSELTHPVRDVRRAALEATVQFGSRTAVPRLRELADLATDPEEKGELLEAAEFLELPSLTEYLQARGMASPPASLILTRPITKSRLGNPAPARPSTSTPTPTRTGK